MRNPINITESNRRNVFALALAIVLAIAPVVVAIQKNEWGDDKTDHPMYLDPALYPPKIVPRFAERLHELWLMALDRPEADLKRQALDAITNAHRRGMKGWGDQTTRIIEVMNADGQHALVQLAAARALVALDAKESAAHLFALATESRPRMVLLVDPALARWRHEPAKQIWMSRVTESKGGRAVIRSAIRSLGTSGVTEAREVLSGIVSDAEADPSLRLASARALGASVVNGLEELAENLNAKGQGTLVDRLCAASIIARHESGRAQELLRTLASDREPAVIAIAYRRLLEIDWRLVQGLAPEYAFHRDATVRRLAGETLIAKKDPEATATLGRMLNDAVPDNRNMIRRAMSELAIDLRDAVIEAAAKTLAGNDCRGLEQAAVLLGKLGHKPAAARLLRLMTFERPEVRMAAIIALRRIGDPSTPEPMFARATKLADVAVKWFERAKAANEKGKSIEPMDRTIEPELAQFNQALGLMGYRAAEPFFREHIRKETGHPTEARAAAIWALGHFHAGKPDAKLATRFMERIADTEDPNWPEAIPVRRMSAVSMGRMKAMNTRDTLESFYKGELSSYHIGGACRWALIHMTGETLPPMKATHDVYQRGWFLEPVD